MRKTALRWLTIVAVLLVGVASIPMASFAQEDPGTAGISGSVSTGVQLQNVGGADTQNLTVQLLPQAGGNAITLPQRTIQREAAINYFLPDPNSVGNVPAGTYSLVATADQPIEAIVRTDFSDNGASGIYGSTPPGTDVIVPLVLRAFAGQTSQITVQSAATTGSSTYRLQLFGRGSATAVVDLDNQTLEAGRSRTYDLGTGTEFQNLPNNGGDLGVTTGFAGYARITVTSGEQIIAQSFIDLIGVGAVAAFSGVASTAAQSTLYVPLVRSNFFGDTGIQIVNPSGTDTNATITFFTDPFSEQFTQNQYDDTYTQQIAVPANSSAIAFQGPTGNSRAAGLPAGGPEDPINDGVNGNTTPTNQGWFGVARIETSGSVGVLAVVNDTFFGQNFAVQRQSTYNSQTSNDAGTRFAIPLVRAFHLAQEQYTTGVQVQNTTASPANVTLTITGYNNQTADPIARQIAANGALNFYQGDIPDAFEDVPPELGGTGWFGSAIITSDQPIVLLVNDDKFPSAPRQVDSANFTALRIQ